jgi:uncharacterized membrane protein
MGVLFRRHVAVGAIVGVVVGIIVGRAMHAAFAPSIGWDAAALTFLVLTWRHIWPLDAERTRAAVSAEEPTRAWMDVVVISAAVLSLLTVFLILFRSDLLAAYSSVIRAALGILTVVFAWAVVHTVLTLRYARMYYSEPVGGIDFRGTDEPAYSDFAYVAFGIGMTFQVADTTLETREFRTTALRHALLSFLFVTTILAVTINLVAGLGH